MTTIGPVSLTVADLSRSLAFFTERLGFRVHDEGEGTLLLGAGGGDLLVLVERKGAPRAPGVPVGPAAIVRDPSGNAVRLAAL